MFLRKHFGNVELSELEDIVENMNHLLAARRGISWFHPNFGFSSGGVYTPEALLERMAREIRENVLLFEPRLEIVAIEQEFDDNNKPRLTVDCRLASNKQELRVAIDPVTKLFVITNPENDEEGDEDDESPDELVLADD